MSEYYLNIMRVLTSLGLFVILLFLAVGSAQAATPPSVLGQGTSAVTASDATLEAQIDPGGAAAYYQFQLAANPSEFADEIFCPTSQESKPFLPCVGPESAGALPIGYISHAEGETTAKLDLGSVGVSLKSGTTYYFRAVAASAVQAEDTIEWEQPVVGGVEESFMTAAYPCPTELCGGSPSADPSGGSSIGSLAPSGSGETVRRRHHLHHRRHHRPRRSSALAVAAAVRAP
jgi:hypothetical protein